jgi:hypothetical protein
MQTKGLFEQAQMTVGPLWKADLRILVVAMIFVGVGF